MGTVHRRRWIAVGVLAAVMAAAGGWLLGRGGQSGELEHAAAAVSVRPADPSPAGSPPAPERCRIRWEQAPAGEPVPISDCAGPRDTARGRARGFAHDELGAVFAAIHVTLRLSSAAGAPVYGPTYAEQTVGDAQAARSAIAQEQGGSPPAHTLPTRWWWRIGAGSPQGDLVVVELAAETAQAAQTGGFAHLSVTLRWVDGDWKLQLPRPRPHVTTTVDEFVMLGPDGGGR